MSPCWIVIGLILGLRLLGGVHVAALDSWTQAVRWGTGVTFIIMGAAHLTPVGRDVQRLVPPMFHRPFVVVLLLGTWQIAGGIGLVTEAARKFAAAGLLVLLVLKFPANIRAAREALRLKGKFATSPTWRIPAQLLWIALVWWSAT